MSTRTRGTSSALRFSGLDLLIVADYDCDVRSDVQTFAVRRPGAAVRLGAFVAFPAELIALAILLWRIAEPLPLVALGCYAVLLAGRA